MRYVYVYIAQVGRLGLRVGGHPAALSLRSSNEPDELLQWLWSGHDDSTINIIMAALCNRAGDYIFALWFLLLLSSSTFFLA